MSLVGLQSLQQVLPKRDSRIMGPSPDGRPSIGPAHFWERALSRRQFLTAGTAATAAFFALPVLSRAAPPTGGLPNPIPGGTSLGPLGFVHFFFPTSTAAPPGALTI